MKRCERLVGDRALVAHSFLSLDPQGFDPQAKTKFQPRHRAKGRSGAGALLRRKRKVAHEEQRVSLSPSACISPCFPPYPHDQPLPSPPPN